jgi:hypothetical protein
MGWKRRGSVAPGLRVTPEIEELPFPFVHVPVLGAHPPAVAPADACDNFTAGGTAVSGPGAGKLDVHGFFVVMCRHGFIWSCADVRTPGER